MNDIQHDDDSRPLSPSSVSIPTSSSLSISSASSDSSSSSENSGGADSERDRPVNLNQKTYTGFIRKPITESHASLGRKRQERSYSDSENSYEEQIPGRANRQGRQFFDFEQHADRQWGRQPLWESLGADQIESLIALAHHGTEPFENNSLLNTASTNALIDVETPIHGFGSVPPNEQVSRNPLLHLVNTPLPLSFLNYFMYRAEKVPEFCDALYESFDDSALVAIGMFVEEMITASLLPFAGCHVLRCQQLERKPSKDEALLVPVQQVSLTHPISNQTIMFDPRNLPDEENPFSAWTLPPDEAIIKIASQGMIPDTGIPLVRDPIRSSGKRNDLSFRTCGNNEVVRRIFKQVGIDARPNREYQDIFLVKKTYKKRPCPRRLDHDSIGCQPQSHTKKIRVEQV